MSGSPEKEERDWRALACELWLAHRRIMQVLTPEPSAVSTARAIASHALEIGRDEVLAHLESSR